MPELDLRGGSSAGYHYDEQAQTRDLYFLAVVFAGSKSLLKFKEPDSEDREFSLFARFRYIEYTEISWRLLAVAAMCRNDLETRGTRRATMDGGYMTVGNLWEGRGSSKPLPLIQACHKILHASDINFDLTDTRNIRSGWLRPYVWLHGEKQGVHWRAKINIFKFIEAVYYALA